MGQSLSISGDPRALSAFVTTQLMESLARDGIEFIRIDKWTGAVLPLTASHFEVTVCDAVSYAAGDEAYDGNLALCDPRDLFRRPSVSQLNACPLARIQRLALCCPAEASSAGDSKADEKSSVCTPPPPSVPLSLPFAIWSLCWRPPLGSTCWRAIASRS
jgi:hypothetical protein